ncbi:MAG TPA: peptide ABC transporter substrate-binding protein [Anaerolineae bacterium]|nr:peptide ABC transporter substrate-binding protein [Anaerolineae bacterium]
MKKIRWQLIVILVTGLVIGALLLSEQTGFRLIRPASTRGSVYTEALIGRLQRLNPVLDYYNNVDRDIDQLLFDSLISFDSRSLPQPELADSWGVSFDGLSYNFELNPDAVWHDGTPVTSEDIAFTIDLLRDPDSVLPEDLKVFWKNIDVISLGEKTLQIRLAEPFSPFMDYLTFGILPKHILGGLTYAEVINSSFNLQPIGSGPYLFERLLVEDGEIVGVILSANEEYYREPPFISQFVLRYYPDVASAYAAYQEGVVQGIGEVTLDMLPTILANQELLIYSSSKPEVLMVLLNLNNDQVPFFQDKDVRRALLMGLDRQRLIDNVMQGQGIIADVPLLKNTWAYYDANPHVYYDIQNAIDLLQEMGYVVDTVGGGVRKKDGVPLSFELVHPDDEIHTELAKRIKENWTKLGVEVTLITVPYDTLVLDYLQPLTYQAALLDLNFSRSPDPDPYPFWDQAQQSGGQNYSQWENRIVSEYLETARVSTDLEERAKLYRNFQVIFSDELPALPLFYPVYNYAVDDGMGAIRMSAMYDTCDRFYNVTQWYLLAQAAGLSPENE